MTQSQTLLRFVIAALAVIVLLVNMPYPAHAQERVTFYEVSASTGLSNKATTSKPAIGFDVGFGFGRNMISAAYNHQSLGDYGVGIGESLDSNTKLWQYQNAHPTTGKAITDSLLKDFSVRYSRDIYGSAKTGIVTFVTGGVGSARTSSVDHYVLFCPACVVFTPVPIPAEKEASTAEFLFGGGLRVRLAKGLGLKGALTVRSINGNTPTYSRFRYDDRGILVDPNLTTPGPASRRDTLVGVSIGVYYRNGLRFN